MVKNMEFGDIGEVMKYKRVLLEKIQAFLTQRELKEALRDPHARRPPRPCGLTVHTGIGCPLQCVYCYIYSMGFKPNFKDYPLSGAQLVYALVSNENFIPGPSGTLIALGSVTEPFLPLSKKKTFEYIEFIKKYLGNPVQFSTKMSLDHRDVETLKTLDPEISPLISVSTLSHQKLLEPLAPPVEKRFETISLLRLYGFKPFLFLRPIIPGVTDREIDEILEYAAESGAYGVVAGSLRVTRSILDRLTDVGLDTSEIIRRLKGREKDLKDNVQYTVDISDIKNLIEKQASKKKLIYLPSACMANAFSHNLGCWRMKSLIKSSTKHCSGCRNRPRA